MDRLGRNHDYRPARIRSSPKPRSYNEGQIRDGEDAEMYEDEDDEEEEDEDEDEDEDERFWPSRAQHDEDSFGYAFDSGDHALCMSSHTCYADSRASIALTFFPSLLSLWSRR